MRLLATILTILIFGNLGLAQVPRTIHVMVALCDNEYQGIVPVPKAIGNGQDPASNLYWGALYGIKTHFKKSPNWTLLKTEKSPALQEEKILERLIFKHKRQNVYLIADAYDGQFIKNTTLDFIYSSGGYRVETINYDNIDLPIKGGANLVAYIGHNGLMDFIYEDGCLPPADCVSRDAILLGCLTKKYFSNILKCTGATPILWTTNFMAPEAYTLEAALEGWVRGEGAAQIRERGAAAYHKYQKCGIRGARGLLVEGF